MFQFAKLLNTLFPFLSFYWLGNRFLWVGRTCLEYDLESNQTVERFEHLGYLVRHHCSPCWVAFEAPNGGAGDWEWNAPQRCSLPAALRELLVFRGYNWPLSNGACAECIEAEDELLLEDALVQVVVERKEIESRYCA